MYTILRLLVKECRTLRGQLKGGLVSKQSGSIVLEGSPSFHGLAGNFTSFMNSPGNAPGECFTSKMSKKSKER